MTGAAWRSSRKNKQQKNRRQAIGPPPCLLRLEILIFLPLGKEEDHGDGKGADLRHRIGEPDAVGLQQQRQQQNGGGLEDQRPQKEMAAETAPSFSAVKKEEAKILKLDSKNEKQNSRKAWTVRASSPAS